MKTLGTHNYYVYMLTNKSKTTLYTGVTNDLQMRLKYHSEPTALNKKAFTTRYRAFYLIYFERFQDVDQAIGREKQIKGWTRAKKEKLIATKNPEWTFLNDSI